MDIWIIGEAPTTVTLDPDNRQADRQEVLDAMWDAAVEEYVANGASERLIRILGEAAFEQIEEGSP
jgi:hypothetical protein